MPKVYDWSNSQENPFLTVDDVPVLHTLLQDEFLTQEDASTLYGGDSTTVKGIKDSISALEKKVETNTSDISTIKGQLEGVEATLSGLNKRMGEVV